ncbi:hypothetical protein TcasGA2_TC015012 [Tribolium castaneum]|uniref:Uncharacterized protein n=1 Tax=Tribolium castaneum TaxID=7070 RepID=D2A6C7_TRICA|nr:PREDICTED: uncharacterized protein LOC103313428 [Tribolium castaneum]EFA04945.2 hypothetical protein TcasGA2_TC015012 [Tribolium castaneum]|eukprot:XP_008194879.1 PREDICTED: uncharacterized protein LOC103313428 [Tribolium castaneum]
MDPLLAEYPNLVNCEYPFFVKCARAENKTDAYYAFLRTCHASSLVLSVENYSSVTNQPYCRWRVCYVIMSNASASRRLSRGKGNPDQLPKICGAKPINTRILSKYFRERNVAVVEYGVEAGCNCPKQGFCWTMETPTNPQDLAQLLSSMKIEEND